jgi:hypothetical protein
MKSFKYSNLGSEKNVALPCREIPNLHFAETKNLEASRKQKNCV